ncbi:RYamide receptor-like [Saccostrea echinata]|uniref:RYamide receptor-like n=1 Tax=Saccostrea echinata TaxID=191078 RepID=UPI002A83E4D9|nr:RYamide receptor-like [Saccostrea echinata]
MMEYENSSLPNSTIVSNGTKDIGREFVYEPLKVPGYVQAIIITAYSITILLSVGGNGTVCYIVFRARRMRTVMNFFIVSLALSDILMAVFCIPFTFIANLVLNEWPFGETMCPVVTFLQSVTVFLSSLTLVAISIDRYVAIIYPFRAKMTKMQAFIVISVIWLFSFVINIPTALTARTHTYLNVSTAPEFCEEILWQDQTLEYIYGVAILLLQYFIPLIIFICAYGRIIIAMWVEKTPGEAVSSRDQRMSESKKKIIRMMIVVVAIYATCWLPLNIINIAGDINPSIYDTKGMNYIWMACHWLAMSNCMYNPFIYCWMNSKFRNGFRRVLSHLTCGYVRMADEVEMSLFRRHDTVNTSVGGSIQRYYKQTSVTSSNDCSSPRDKIKSNGHIYNPVPSSI